MELYTSQPSRPYKEIGLVEGNIVKGRFFVHSFIANIKKMAGMEITQYTELMKELRNEAKKRLIEEAKQRGADAVICVRYNTAMITYEAGEMIIYGTAIKWVDK